MYYSLTSLGSYHRLYITFSMYHKWSFRLKSKLYLTELIVGELFSHFKLICLFQMLEMKNLSLKHL